MSGFKDKSIVVTGGGSGIGRAAVEILCEQGALVTVADMNEAGAMETAKAATTRGPGRAQAVRTDVTSEDSVRAMVAAAVSAYGKLDGAINGAGVPPAGKPVHELSLADFNANLSVNLIGVFLCIKYEAAAMLQTDGGAICAISSAAAVMGHLHSSDYCAAKAGVTGLVRSAAIDYAKRGIRVNTLLPGAVDTPLATRAREQNPAIVGTFAVPMDRRASPREMAASAVWMISDDSSYMTGSCVTVDAGMTIA